ncbi:MAG TPA: cytochrome b [Rudaea sp.]|jgi:cytochrome b561|nr:cytochrome b [Rudaea sp.]
MREHSIPTSYDHVAALTTSQRSRIQMNFARLRANSIRTSGEHRLVMRAAPARLSRKSVSGRQHRSFTRFLHWTTFALLILAAASVGARELIEGQATRQLLLAIHEWTGLTVLALLLPRLAWRVYAGVGKLHATMSPRTRIPAALGHYALYATTLALPVLGWLTANAYGQTLRLFGLLPLPALMARDRELGYGLQDWHVDAAWVLLALVLGHVAAALWHHYIRRDNVLRSMQPYLRRRDVRRRDLRRARAAALLSRLRAVLQRHRELARTDAADSRAAKMG